jgi:pimeloyl-ACP methyl ester carboxylesterase
MRTFPVVLMLSAVLLGQHAAPAPLGKLVDLGGYRIHLYCTGQGRPTVLLSPGGGDFSFDWWLVQQRLSTTMRVCSYDRGGAAWSDPGPQPLTMKQEAFELRAALDRSGEHGAYIVVGQSIGGLVMRVFAELYPADVAGVVLVDATSPDTTLNYRGKLLRMREQAKERPVPEIQNMNTSPPKPPSEEEMKEWAYFQREFGGSRIQPPFDQLPPEIQKLRLWASSLPPKATQSENYFPEELRDLYQQTHASPHPLGDRPLITIVAAKPQAPPPGVSQQQWDALVAEKIAQKKEYAELSTNSKIMNDPNSSHAVHLDNPSIVVSAIAEVARAIKQRGKLTP